MSHVSLMLRPVPDCKLHPLVRERIVVSKERRLERIIVASVNLEVTFFLSFVRLKFPPIEEDRIIGKWSRRPAEWRTFLYPSLIKRHSPRVLIRNPSRLVKQERSVARRGQVIDAPTTLGVLLHGCCGRSWRRQDECAPVLERRDGVQRIRSIGRDQVHDTR